MPHGQAQPEKQLWLRCNRQQGKQHHPLLTEWKSFTLPEKSMSCREGALIVEDSFLRALV